MGGVVDFSPPIIFCGRKTLNYEVIRQFIVNGDLLGAILSVNLSVFDKHIKVILHCIFLLHFLY